MEKNRYFDNLDYTMRSFADMSPPNLGLRIGQASGLLNSKNMYWAWNKPTNFGDWIGPALYYACNGNLPLWSVPRLYSCEKMFFTVGSILQNIRYSNKAIVWGSGIIRRNDHFKKPRDVLSVRGPITRERFLELGYDCPKVYGDPGLLLSDLIEPAKSKGQYEIGLIPHIRNRSEVASYSRLNEGVKVIDLTKPIPDVVGSITSCDVVLSSSLHGLIVSHAYGIPACWVSFKEKLSGDGVKFLDYAASVDLDYSGGPVLIEKSTIGKCINEAVVRAKAPDKNRIESIKNELWRTCPFK